LYYHLTVAVRSKRSISIPPELDAAIAAAAAVAGMTVSGWLVQTAAHRLRLDAAKRAVREWELENGSLTDDELASGRALAAKLLAAADHSTDVGHTNSPTRAA
jgi:hypothetical protein